jgi:ATP-dependent helicase/nuclease subunit A
MNDTFSTPAAPDRAPPPRPEVVQRRASDPAASVWVSASAGTGKTRVLTERVLRLMLGGTAPERILCITFTKAAAAEMANRITRTLARWATLPEAALQQALADLTGARPAGETEQRARRLFAQVLDVPGGMRIMTIHAFCQSLLRRFPLEAQLPPHFELMDDRTAAELLLSVRNALLAAPPEAVRDALALVAGRIDEGRFNGLMAELTGERGRLARLIDDHGGAEALVAAVFRELDADPDDTEEALVARACRDDAFDGGGLRRTARALLDGGRTDAERGDGLAAWLADPDGRAARIDGYTLLFLTQKGEVRKRLLTKAVERACPDAGAVLAAEAERMLALAGRRRALGVARSTAALLTLGAAILDRYEAEKRRRALLDYDDLILRTADLLRAPGVAPWVLYKLDGGIDHVLIDEAQDTNPDQWQVIAALSEDFFAGQSAHERPRTVFAVGDEKQSIYSFQRADPAEFARMHRHFADRLDGIGTPLRRVELHTSFRSTAAVLTAVDAVFAQDATRDGVALDPATRITHTAWRRGHGGLVELWPAVGPADAEEPPPWEPPTDQGRTVRPETRLAQRIAATIDGWLARGERLEARGRPIHPGDVMVLVRRRNAFFTELVRALKDRGVPVAGVDRMVLTHQLAVMDMMALGHVLLLPEDDLTLATVLKGPLIGFTEEQLFAVAHGREGTLWQALSARADRDPAFAAARDWLGGLLARVDYLRPYELFAGVLDTPCPADPLSGRRAVLGRLGPEAEDPLDEFLSLALAYEEAEAPSLQRFLHWAGAGEAEVKREMEAGEQRRVRIMTVHGAKGLQAPIVILPDTTSVPKQSPAILWPDRPGGVPLWAPRRALEEERCRAAREAANDRRDKEYRRLLYVALTRAEDRLYVCGYHGVSGAAEGCWHGLCRTGLEQGLDGVPALPLSDDGTGDVWDGTMLRYHVPQTRPAEAEPHREAPAVAPLPSWARAPAPKEPEPARPLAPSRPEEEPPVTSPLGADAGARFRRGRLIHALLELLPDVAPAARPVAARRFLAQPVHGLDPDAQAAIAAETLAVLDHPEFAALFGPDSGAEVPIVGRVAGRTLSGQIDRLLVAPDRILAVDYKTSRSPPPDEAEVPAVYLRQMAAYRAALQAMYPGRAVRCALLWTDGPALMPLSDARLDHWAP